MGSPRKIDYFEIVKFNYLYTNRTNLLDHLARIKRHRGKALIDGNGYSLIKINNAAYKPFKLALRELSIKLITSQNE
jgi:hypothetical protein